VEIKVLEIRQNNGGKTRAFVDISLNDIVIRDFRILEEHGKPHVKIPYLTYRAKDGQMRFRDVLIFPPRVREEIDSAILSAFFRWEREGGSGKSTP